MSPADLVNGSFEGIGALVLLLNIRRLLRDKMVRGVHWAPVAFWTLWGYWNVFYYPSLGQSFSFVAGLAVAAVNTVQLALLVKYWKR